MSRALTEYALSFEFYNSDLITNSDHKILVAHINVTDAIPNNWSHSLQTPITLAEKEHKWFIVNFHDVTKEYWSDFNEMIKEKIQQRKLHFHIQEFIDKQNMTWSDSNSELGTRTQATREDT